MKYVLKIPGFGSKNEESLNFGSFIHRVFELGYKEADKKSLVKLAESERAGYKIPFQMNDRILACIENFILWNNKLGETISTEVEIEAPLDEKNDIKFIGIIDRIVKGKDGGILVIDYKTSKREKKKAELLDDKQLKGYAYAVSVKYGIPLSSIWCAHYYPVSGNFIPVQFSRFQIGQWKRKEIDKVWRIRKKKKDEFPAQSNIFCNWCEMQPVCEKFCSKEQVAKNLNEQILLKEERKNAILEAAEKKDSGEDQEKKPDA